MTNYERLFGTPEKMVRVIEDICASSTCCSPCPLHCEPLDFCYNGIPDDKSMFEHVLEWLNQEVDE